MAPNALATDGYKFSMAQAGFPLREETFYLSFRKGGWQYVPYDLKVAVQEMLPSVAEISEDDHKFLRAHGYGLSEAMLKAFASEIEVHAVPAGAWVHEREPILTVTGPSFLVSWLEPHVLRLFYPLQLGRLFKRHEKHPERIPEIHLACTCEEHAQIARRVVEAVRAPGVDDRITVRRDWYEKWVRYRVGSLLAIVGDPSRIFEVGMRAAVCEQQHRIALEVCRDVGLRSTSNVELALDFDMRPVGTMGHEHVQRWGNDLDAYRAMRDMREAPPSYLLDTFDTITSGIPSAIKVMREREHECSIRYDSGDKFGQYVYAHGEFARHGLEPMHVIEDGLDDIITAKFERLRSHTELPPAKQIYGYGGFLIDHGWNGIGRDEVSAVYKLTQTSGNPRMKFGNEEGLGKISVPGHPVAWRRLRGTGPVSIIAQLNEDVPDDYVLLNGNPEAVARLRVCNVEGPETGSAAYVLSPETQRLVENFTNSRNR